MIYTKQTYYSIIPLLAGLLMAVLATACSSRSREPEPPSAVIPSDSPVAIRLELAVDAPADSRDAVGSGSGESFHPGCDGESYVDLEANDVKVYFFTVDYEMTFITSVSPASFHSPELIDGQMHYKLMTAPIYGLPSDGKVRVAVLANCGGKYPPAIYGSTTLAQFEESLQSVFPVPAGLPGSGEGKFAMPFFALRNITLQYDESGTFHAGTFNLLRALVKITITCTDNSGYPLEAATLVNGNKDFSTMPRQVFEETDYIKPSVSNPTLQQNWTSPLNIPANSFSGQPIQFLKTSENSFTLFAAEADVKGKDFENGDKTKERPYILLDFGEGGQRRIDFKNYSDGKTVYDLHRNWWFHFNVTKSYPLDVSLDVEPYREVELRPAFGLDRNEEGNLIISFPADPETIYELLNDHDGLGLYLILENTRIYVSMNNKGYVKLHVYENWVKKEVPMQSDEDGNLYITVNGKKILVQKASGDEE